MSVISQFFPSPGGSSSGGGAGNIGGGTTPVEIIGMGGGGGAGGCAPFPACGGSTRGIGGDGGMGAIFYANNYFISPGTTYPITIGAGGVAGSPSTSSATQGTNGGATSFNNPECKLCVCGGGGGGASTNSAPNGDATCGKDGGTGGAGGNIITSGYGPGYHATGCLGGMYGCGGRGAYHERQLKVTGMCQFSACLPGSPASGAFHGQYENVITSNAETLKTPWGFMGGFDAYFEGYLYKGNTPASQACYVMTCGGGAMSNVIALCRSQPCAAPADAGCTGRISAGCMNNIDERYFELNWFTSGRICLGCIPSYIGSGGEGISQSAGCPGTVIIRYPDQFAAATVVNGTDCSPVTPGYRSYRFSTSGSITL